MTTFEHATVGATAALAIGLHRRAGWQIVAVAAVAGISPDWDGLPFLFSIEWFDRIHRVWGHNLWAAGLVGAVIGASDFYFDWTSRCGRTLQWLFDRKKSELMPLAPPRSPWLIFLWLTVGVLAAWSHLPADMVYSGNATLGDWPLQLFWPFSKQGYVFPLVPWGDVGASVIFTLGILAMLRWRSRLQLVAAGTLLAVAAYIIVRGLSRL